MRVPDPDAVLVGAMDGLAALPQRAGINLARVRRVTPCLILIMLAFGVVNLAVRGEHILAMVWCMPAITVGSGMWRTQAKLAADAGRWSPDLARDYRARALSEREKNRGTRLTLTILTAVYVWVSLNMAMAGRGLTVGESWPMLTVLACLSVHSYLRCTFPHDPDLRAPARTAA